LQKEQQTLLLLYNCSHVLCVILPRQRRASSVRISLVIVNEEEEQQQTVVVVSLFVVVVIDDAQKRSPIAPSLRKEKCIIYSEGTRSRTTIAAQTTRTSFFFVASSALSQGVLSRGDCLECNNHLKINSQKKRFVPFQTTKNRREVNTRKIERLRMTRLY
jgi:acyl-CoA hydrolase